MVLKNIRANHHSKNVFSVMKEKMTRLYAFKREWYKILFAKHNNNVFSVMIINLKNDKPVYIQKRAV